MNTPASYRKLILEKIPEGSIVPRHTKDGHFYEVVPAGKVFTSVTTKLQVLKDESLTNYKMNRALDYVFANYKKISDETVMEILSVAKEQSGIILRDAGDIGTAIHQYRENYFNDWIKGGIRPADARTYIPEFQTDPRAISGMRALEKFVKEKGYTPIVSEQLVYDTKFEVAGTLDDVGLMRKEIRPPSPGCECQVMTDWKGITRCFKCDWKYKEELVLMDLKTSNQFKDHYFFQVAMYFMMFIQLTGLKPKRCFILKVSKEDGTYKIEELKQFGKLVRYAKNMLKVNEALDFIRSVRKDNQRVVISI